MTRRIRPASPARGLRCLLVTALLLGTAVGAQANRVKLRPFFAFRATYNDNVEGVDEKRVEPLTSYILSYSPGLSLVYLTERSTIDLSYRLGFEDYRIIDNPYEDEEPFLDEQGMIPNTYYQRYGDDPDADLDYLSHNGRIVMSRQYRRYTLTLSSNILVSRRLEDQYRNTDRTNAARFVSWQLSPQIEYRPTARWTTLLQYKLDFLIFKDDDAAPLIWNPEIGGFRRVKYSDDNREAHYGILSNEYKWDERSTMRLQYVFIASSFKKYSDYRSHQITLGYERSGPKYGFFANAQFLRHDFELEGNYLANRMDSFEQANTFAGNVRFTANQENRLFWSIEAERGRNIFGTNNYYIFNRAATSATYHWSRKLSTTAMFDFALNDYDTEVTVDTGEARQDIVFRLGANTRYHPKPWLSLTLAYDYRKRDSNQVGFDLSNHLVWLEIRVFPTDFGRR